MVPEDIPQVHKLLNKVNLDAKITKKIFYCTEGWNLINTLFFQQYLERFDLVPIFTVEEVRHWFTPKPGIVDSYVVQIEGKIEGA